MNHIFHYYITGFLALKAGFTINEACIIAYSAQYVDHALIPYRLRGSDPKWHGQPEYTAIATHHFGFWDAAQEDSVWLPFHFFPAGLTGPDAARRDGQANFEAVHPNSPPVRELLISALKTDNLYRIGIALHTFSDSWAHQNFTGRRSNFNRLSSASLLPPIGHAQAESSPDIMHAHWLDPRLNEPVVDNRRRFLEAARLVYKYLATNRQRGFEDSDLVMAELELLLGPTIGEDQAQILGNGIQAAVKKKLDSWLAQKSYPLLCGKADKELEFDFQIATGMPPYDRMLWRSQAIADKLGTSYFDSEREANLNDKAAWIKHEIFSRSGAEIPVLAAEPGFFDSHFYKWSESAREHVVAAKAIISRL